MISSRWATRLRLAIVVLSIVMIGVAGSPALALQSTPVATTPEVTPPANPSPLSVTHGLQSGDVTDTSAVVWARASGGPAQMHVDYDTDPTFADSDSAQSDPDAVTDATDYTAQLVLHDLQPNTTYYYRVWF